jgi:hypothetical protein
MAPLSCIAQEVFTLRGQVLDASDDKPIPFVNIILNGYYYGTSSNLEGRFELKIRKDQVDKNNFIQISCIGYENQRIRLGELNFAQFQHIQLNKATNSLTDFVVKGNRLRRKEQNQSKTLLMDAIDRIPSNRAKRHYEANTFYRHYCKEDTSYVRLIEAAMSLYQDKNSQIFRQIPEHKMDFQVAQLRRSFDFTAFAKLEHPPISLNFLLSNDLMNYEFRNPIRKALDLYELAITDTTEFNNEPVAIIHFNMKKKASNRIHYEGDLYINLRDLAFVRADVRQSRYHSTPYDSVRSIVDKKIFYQKIGNRYYPSRAISDVDAKHFNRLNPQESTSHHSHVELMVNEIKLKGSPDGFMDEEPGIDELNAIAYDSAFWNSYTVLQSTPLEDEIIQDLSARISLDQQFVAYNELRKGLAGIIESEDFSGIMDSSEAQYRYVVFWAGWAAPNYYELIPSSAAKRMVKKGLISIELISLDKTEDWLQNRTIHGLEQPLFRHSQIDFGIDEDIVKKFYQDQLPRILLINQYDQVIDERPALLSDENFDNYLQDILSSSSGPDRSGK